MLNKIVAVIAAILLVFAIFIIINSFDTPDLETEKTLYVGGSEDGNYNSIQDAINASSDGDTVFVFSGTYNESISISKSINLIGEDKLSAILSYNNDSQWPDIDIITISATYVNISGFTIQNSPHYGINISSEADNCLIYQNIIQNNSIGIIISESKKLTIFNNTFYHNNFVNNTEHANDTRNNIWSYNTEGNYWDDYNGTDNDSDGIGDEPYEIPGGDNIDEYPLMMPYVSQTTQEFQVDEGLLYQMLIVGLIAAILFVLPIGYVWYRKYYRK
jgi:parallel beta-helix repeat protein